MRWSPTVDSTHHREESIRSGNLHILTQDSVKNDPNQPEDAVSIDDRERILGGPAEAVGALDAVSGPPEEAARAALAQSARAILHEGRRKLDPSRRTVRHSGRSSTSLTRRDSDLGTVGVLLRIEGAHLRGLTLGEESAVVESPPTGFGRSAQRSA